MYAQGYRMREAYAELEGRPRRDCWWMHAGDAAVRLAWKLLWSWRGESGSEAPMDRSPVGGRATE